MTDPIEIMRQQLMRERFGDQSDVISKAKAEAYEEAAAIARLQCQNPYPKGCQCVVCYIAGQLQEAATKETDDG